MVIVAASGEQDRARWEERMWQQVYDPFGNGAFSTVTAAIPVATLLVLIATGESGPISPR
jgi:hypothetical protein